jgi:probable F420-dependent oxidoreductase
MRRSEAFALAAVSRPRVASDEAGAVRDQLRDVCRSRVGGRGRRYAEAARFESVWTGEHVVLPDPQPRGFTMPPALPFLDTAVALTLIATHTTTVKLASGIIILPLRNPVLLAKELASIDVVSNGRLIVGVGAGYVREEFAAAGIPLTERDERMDDSIAALRALWTMERPYHRGRFVSIDGIDAHPRPLQRPGPPIVVGGESRTALRRAVEKADGWYGFYLDPVEIRSAVGALRRIAAERDRPAHLGPLEITVTPRGAFDRSRIEQCEELGVDRLVLLPRPDVAADVRHQPVPLDQIKRTVDVAVRELQRL